MWTLEYAREVAAEFLHNLEALRDGNPDSNFGAQRSVLFVR